MRTYLIISLDHLKVSLKTKSVMNSFKDRTDEIKSKYNYKFKSK